jgi:hypothetical protein
MSGDLVKRLKKWADGEAMAAYGEHLVDHPDEHEGSQISELIDTLTDRIEELEADLRSMALDYLAAQGQAMDNFQMYVDANEARIDAEANLKTAEEIGRAFEEDAGQLREKLAKAAEALGLLDKAAGETARMGAVTGPHWTRLTIALLKSRATLAELNYDERSEKKGETDA